MTTFDLALLILRLVIGLTFAAHGAQKAFGWWQGPGPVRWVQAIHGMGFHPPLLFAAASILAELAGGLALALGIVTPMAAAILIAQSIVIVFKTHLPNGFFSTQGGVEFPLLMGAGSIAIALLGPGSMSIDGAFGLGFEAGARVGLVLAGLGAGCLALALPRLIPAPMAGPVRRAH